MSARSYRRRLPHWRREGATYFVTWRLHRSQPGLTGAERRAVLETIRYSDGTRFALLAAVVMEDHVHALVSPLGIERLEALVRNWKACGASRLRAAGRTAPFWQREYYDTIVRSPAGLQRIIRYIADNPEKRWPGIGVYPWLYLRRQT